MPYWKCQMIFGFGETGWTETIYSENDTIENVFKALDALAPQRCFILAKGVVLEPERARLNYWRVSRIGTIRTSQIKRVTQDYPAMPESGRPDMPWTGIKCTLTSSGGNKRIYTIKGVPDSQTTTPWEAPPGGALEVAILQYLTALGQAPWRMQVYDPAAPLRFIQSMAVSASGTIVVTDVAHGLATGNLIRWYRVDATGHCFRGHARVRVLTADTFEVPKSNVKTLVFNNGQYAKVQYTYVNIVQFSVDRKGKHDVGRPFAPLRGRRRPCKK